jgi:hypothetical protein
MAIRPRPQPSLLPHTFEMLLKAGLIQAGVSVFDRKIGRSIGFEKYVSLAIADATIKLSEAYAGTLRDRRVSMPTTGCSWGVRDPFM